MKHDKEIREWLESCPSPVIARVVDTTEDVRHIGISSFVYESGTLVVIPVKVVGKLLKEL
tara:strand:+ start:5652 stop:5831 length:180 start_codon:yes stop_codon:yes gene_type:complete